MASSLRISRGLLLAVLLGLFVLETVAQTRLRGTVSAFDGKTVTVDGKAQVLLGEKTEIVYTQPIALSDIKPGDFLGVTSMKQPDGRLVAYEVRRFPKPLNPGHRPFDGRDDQTMTNAAVGAVVQSASGRELTMTYPGGAQKIEVPESALVSTLVPGGATQLVPGAPVNLTMDASGIALRIQVGPPRQ
jgi:Domain of unknown function (DUF5666)